MIHISEVCCPSLLWHSGPRRLLLEGEELWDIQPISSFDVKVRYQGKTHKKPPHMMEITHKKQWFPAHFPCNQGYVPHLFGDDPK